MGRGKKKKTPEQLRQERLNNELIAQMEAAEQGRVNGEPAKVREGNKGISTRVDVLYGGEGKPDGKNHGHLVSNDGLNADYLREPGSDHDNFTVDNNMDNPYR